MVGKLLFCSQFSEQKENRRKKSGHLYGRTEWNRSYQTGSKSFFDHHYYIPTGYEPLRFQFELTIEKVVVNTAWIF